MRRSTHHDAESRVASSAAGIYVAPEPTDASIPDGERKTVTALFADIKGSMELMEDLDPEEARAIVDPALKLMIDAVHRYDGYVVQSTGDGIFALFGAPVAHEDHPQRALYAALRMQEELTPLLGEVARGRQPADRGARRREHRRSGGALDPDRRRATPSTRRSGIRPISPRGCRRWRRPVRSRSAKRRASCAKATSRSSRSGPTRVKGVSEPVNVYEVTGLGPLRTRLQRSAGRGLTKFVGREREMEALRNARRAGARAGHGQIVAAMAEAGIGKSRLFFEFKATTQSGWMVLETFSVSHGKASAYLPVIDLLHNYFEIVGEDDERNAPREGHRDESSRSIEAWKTRCRTCSACSVSSRATTRWRRWTGRSRSGARSRRSSAFCCARSSISR